MDGLDGSARPLAGSRLEALGLRHETLSRSRVCRGLRPALVAEPCFGTVGGSRSLRPCRRRPGRSRQAGRRARRIGHRQKRCRHRYQVLQKRLWRVAPRALSARPRLRRQRSKRRSARHLSQGRRQGLDLGDGRTQRCARHRQRRRPRLRRGAQIVRARGGGRQCARRHQSRCGQRRWRRHVSQSGAGARNS